ncbi:MAG: tetratricopeptide repeat protein [Bacteroidales bacterium]|nr:tetratricopeptide repeat protein [Bacteroidales bacterium]
MLKKIIVTSLICLFAIFGANADTLRENHVINITRLEEKLKTSSLNEKPLIYNQLAREYLGVSDEKSLRYARNSLNLSVISDNRAEEAHAYYIIGLAYYNLDDFDKAGMNFETALTLEYNNNNPERLSDIFLHLGEVYEQKRNYDSALAYFQKSIETEQKSGNPNRLGNRYKELGDVYYKSGNLKTSLEYYFTALELEEKEDSIENIADLHNYIGIVMLDLGNYEKALEHYLTSLKMMEQLGNKQGQARSLNNIGIVYYDWGNKEKALEYYQKSMLIEEELNNERGLSGSLNNIGIIYADWGQHDLAIDFYSKSLDISKKYGDKIGIAQTMNNIGESYFGMGKHDKALENLLISLEAEKQLGNLPGTAVSYNTVGDIYFKLNKPDLALKYSDSSMAIADSLGLTAVKLSNFKLLSNIYAATGNNKKAFDYLGLYTQLKDTIYNRDFLDQMTKIQMKYEIDKKEQEKDVLIREFKEREKIIKKQKIYVFIIFFSLIVIIFIVFYDKRLKQKANLGLKMLNNRMYTQKNELSQTLTLLGQSEEKYRKLVKNSPTGILYMNTSGKILEVNDKMLEILGSPGEEKTKQINCLQFGPLKEAGLVDDILKCIETGELVYNEKPYTTKWKKKIEVRYFITPIKDKEQKITNLILNVEDITLRKDAETALIRSEMKYKNLIENSLQGIFVLQNNRLTFANNRMTGLTQYTVEELENSRIAWYDLFVHPDDREKARLMGESEIHEKLSEEIRFVRKNGTIRWIQILASPFDYEGKMSQIIVAMDISGHKESESILVESEKKLKEANATKDKFFSIIAHDLRNPFNAIIGFSNLLISSYETMDEQERKNIIKNISEASERTYKLLQNLLEWARTQTANLEFHPKMLDACVVVNEIIAELKPHADNKKITLISEIPFNTQVKSDENMLKTIIRNLISNGIKFTHPGGKVSVISGKKDHDTMICIEDNGVGIDEKDKNRLFNPDFQLRKAGTAGEAGTGLGLVLCKEFVKKSGGTIWAESGAIKGSRFCFTISGEE